MNGLKKSTSAVVVAAGQSKRMGPGENKILMDLGGATVLERTLSVFAGIEEILEIVLVVSEQDMQRFKGEFLERLQRQGVKQVVPGGAKRFDSSCAGIRACKEDSDLILIHDGARPFAPVDAIREAIRKAAAMGAAILAVPVRDTLKRGKAGSGIRARGGGGTGVGGHGGPRGGDKTGSKRGGDGDTVPLIAETIEREGLYRAQTPQVFRRSVLLRTIERARVAGISPTDDASLVEALGGEVAIVNGTERNIKITTPEDLHLARALLDIG